MQAFTRYYDSDGNTVGIIDVVPGRLWWPDHRWMVAAAQRGTGLRDMLLSRMVRNGYSADGIETSWRWLEPTDVTTARYRSVFREARYASDRATFKVMLLVMTNGTEGM